MKELPTNVCRDSRSCFAKELKESLDGTKYYTCDCLDVTYEDGKCPFCKPHRRVTNGVRYPKRDEAYYASAGHYNKKLEAKKNNENLIYLDDLTEGREISQRLLWFLKRNGFVTLNDVADKTEAQIAKLRGLGIKSVTDLSKLLANHGLEFKRKGA